MSSSKPWDTGGPPRRRSPREKGRDEKFRDKVTGNPDDVDHLDWSSSMWLVKPLEESIGAMVTAVHGMGLQLEETTRIIGEALVDVNTQYAKRFIREEKFLADYEPGLLLAREPEHDRVRWGPSQT